MFFSGAVDSVVADFLADDFLWATLEPSVTWTECGFSLRIKVDFFMVYQGLVSVKQTVWVNRMWTGPGPAYQLNWRGMSIRSQGRVGWVCSLWLWCLGLL